MKNNNGVNMQNRRAAGESFPEYRARVLAVNKEIKARLRGTFAHVSSQPVTIGIIGKNAEDDKQVAAGRIRGIELITLKGSVRDRFGRLTRTGEQLRIGRTKGVTFVRTDKVKLSEPKRPGPSAPCPACR